MVFGILCAVLGAGIWALNFYGGGFVWGRDWPFLLLVFGLYHIWKYASRKSSKKKSKSKVKDVLKELESKKIDVKEALRELEE